MESTSTPPKQSRRRQADRSAETRRRILDATIGSLYRLGYAAVTISVVAQEAGVSRGIIGYHFPTKADLMVAVREDVHQHERRDLDETRTRVGSGEYFRQLPRHVVNEMRREPAIAVNEIMLGARADPELSAKLRATEREIDTRAVAQLRAYYTEMGVEPPEDLPVIMRVWVAAFRGLAIADLVQGEDAQVEASIDYLTRLLQRDLPPANRDSASQKLSAVT